MPLFGKSNNKENEKRGYPVHGAGGYPTAPPPAQYAPPQAAQYMAPQYGQPQQFHPGHPMGAMPAEAPPPYAPPGAMPQYGQAPHGAYGHPQYAHPQYAHPGYGQPARAPPATVVVHGAFDAGARFDGVARPNIPPPPPGYMPNAAQMAAAQGHTVMGTQQDSNWLTGGSSGGYTVW